MDRRGRIVLQEAVDAAVSFAITFGALWLVLNIL